jgi:hypothetical protein
MLKAKDLGFVKPSLRRLRKASLFGLPSPWLQEKVILVGYSTEMILSFSVWVDEAGGHHSLFLGCAMWCLCLPGQVASLLQLLSWA